jgi:hypothetical protein
LPSLTAMTEPLAEGDTLVSHVDRKVAEMSPRVANLEILMGTRSLDDIEGRPMEQLCLRWMTATALGKLEETVVLIGPPRGEAGRVTVFTMTTRPDGTSLVARPVLDTVVKSVRFGPSSASPGPRRCEVDGVSFEPPRGWDDATVTTFSGDGSPAPSILATLERMRPGDTLRMHTDRKIARLGHGADMMVLEETQPSEVGGRAALESRFLWRSKDDVMEQVLVLVDSAEDLERQITLLNLTAPFEEEGESQARAIFATLLTTVEFAKPPSPPASRPPAMPVPQELAPFVFPMPGSPRR